MTEAQLQSAIIQCARALGWRVLHLRPARMQSGGWATPIQADGAGWPDLFMVRGGRVIAAELKSETGRLSPAQDAWIAALIPTGAVCAVWRPSHWHSGLVEQVLRDGESVAA